MKLRFATKAVGDGHLLEQAMPTVGAAQSSSPSPAKRYLVALGCVLVAFVIRYWLTPVLGEELPFMMFIAAALIAAWYGGAATGIVALMLGLLLANHFFMPARTASPASLEALRLIRYVFTAALGVALIEVLHRGRRRTEAALEKFKQEAARRQRTEAALLEAQSQLRAHASELEHHVAERTAKLAAAVHSLEGILHHIAHNLRAPLRAMGSFSAILLSEHGSNLSPTGKEYCQYIGTAAQRMDTLIHDLLEYGAMSQAEVELRTVSLQETVKHAMECLADKIESTKADFQIVGRLPDVQANPKILEQIVTHLLDNSLKFVPPGLPPKVRLWTEARDRRLRLWIADNGIGIDPQYHARIFGAFETLHPVGKYEGTGIGLAIVKEGIERMGGQAGVESEPGAGSRFWIEFGSGGNE